MDLLVPGGVGAQLCAQVPEPEQRVALEKPQSSWHCLGRMSLVRLTLGRGRSQAAHTRWHLRPQNS